MSEPLPALNESVKDAPLTLPVDAPPVGRSLAWGMKWSSVHVVWVFAARVGRGLVIPKLLTPAQYGLMASINVLINYSQYADVGMKYYLAKQLPYTLHNKGKEGYQELANKGSTWTLICSGLFALVLIVWSCLQTGGNAWFYRPALRILAAIVVCGRIREFLGIMLFGKEEFRFASLGSMIADSVAFLVCVIGLLTFGLLGAVVGMLVGEIAGSAYYLRFVRFRPAAVPVTELHHMLGASMSLLIVALMDALLMTVDQLFLLKFFDKDQYGIYSLGLAMATIALSVSAVFINALQPRVMSLTGRGLRREAHFLVDSSITLYMTSVLVLLGGMLPAIAIFVRVYLPKYASGIPVYVLICGFALARGPAILLRAFYISQNREKRLVAYQAAGVVLTTVSAAAAIYLHAGVIGITMSALAGFSLLSILMLFEFERAENGSVSLTKYWVMGFGLAVIVGTYKAFERFAPLAHLPQYAAKVSLVGCCCIAASAMLVAFSWSHLKRAILPLRAVSGTEPTV